MEREKLITGLYIKVFPRVARFIAKSGGSFDDARDIFHDAVIIYYEKIMVKGDHIEKPAAYLTGISRYLWINKSKVESRFESLDEIVASSLVEEGPQKLSTAGLLTHLEAIGQRCLEILTRFYYQRMPLKELSETLGFSTIRSATVQKYKCIEKLREEVKSKSLSYEDFLEEY